MPIKLLLAHPKDNEGLAKIFVSFWNEENPNVVHTLRLHQGKDGKWNPEIILSPEIQIRSSSTNLSTVFSALATHMRELTDVLNSNAFLLLHDVQKLL